VGPLDSFIGCGFGFGDLCVFGMAAEIRIGISNSRRRIGIRTNVVWQVVAIGESKIFDSHVWSHFHSTGEDV
jgi:hypothetical protein